MKCNIDINVASITTQPRNVNWSVGTLCCTWTQLQLNTPARHNTSAPPSTRSTAIGLLGFGGIKMAARGGDRGVRFLISHQVHHSSEYYNLSTALRQSLVHHFLSWVFYLPMALAVPPSVFAVHIEFNLLYQFWIHTEVIKDLGPLEWILNTPSHHRVHHGRNLYCIDKNYGGVLIVWDRLFGTFTPEKDKVVYGLVFPIKTYESLNIQFHYYRYLWRKASRFNTLSEKLSTFSNGPSWKPGKPRLGDHEQVPHLTGKELPLDRQLSLAARLYLVIHFLLVLGLYFKVKTMQSQLTVLAMIGYMLLTFTSLGHLMDRRPKAAVWEMLRCAVMLAMQSYGYMEAIVPALTIPAKAFVSLCLLFWVLHNGSQLVRIKNKSN
ncbi:unnamed protein product [Arctogadus glacialis]